MRAPTGCAPAGGGAAPARARRPRPPDNRWRLSDRPAPGREGARIAPGALSAVCPLSVGFGERQTPPRREKGPPCFTRAGRIGSGAVRAVTLQTASRSTIAPAPEAPARRKRRACPAPAPDGAHGGPIDSSARQSGRARSVARRSRARLRDGAIVFWFSFSSIPPA